MSFSDFSKLETLKAAEAFLADKSYVDGYVIGLNDEDNLVRVFEET